MYLLVFAVPIILIIGGFILYSRTKQEDEGDEA
jgi:hypothetical protein